MAQPDTFQFWMVWNPAKSLPMVQHPSAQSARREAHRLASTNPGERFYVLKGLRYVEVNNTTEVELQQAPPSCAVDDGIPF